jgi:N-acetylglucosamine kinase-like BadF-type ATPase
MGSVLGMEGGGDHSHAIVADMSGTVLGVGANDDPSNWEDVGIEAAAGAIRSCVREALNSAGVGPDAIEASIIAIAGMDFPMDPERLSGVPAALGLPEPWEIVNDAFAAMRAGTDQPFGVVVLAGNGSVVAGRGPAGENSRSLGLGPMFGDSGSETDISHAAVTAVAEAFTGRGPQTALTDQMCVAAGVGSPIEFLDGASRGRIDSASFASNVLRAAEEGDAVAAVLLTRAGGSLGDSAAHVVQRLHMQEAAFDLVLAGSMFQAETPLMVDALEARVRPVAPAARLRRLHAPPVVGAALMAIELSGRTPPSGARTSLSSGFAARV